MDKFKELGPFSDIVDFKQRTARKPHFRPGKEAAERVKQVLNFSPDHAEAQAVSVDTRWTDGDLSCEELSWSVGYGPRTRAWLFKPLHANEPLPGIAALHDHGGFKYYGKEKIAKGPEPGMERYHRTYYGGRAFANALAKRGFVTLVHDVFTWGSRRFPLEAMDERSRMLAETLLHENAAWSEGSLAGNQEVTGYNLAAGNHEQQVEKYCSLLGSTFAGIVNYEDRVAIHYLSSRTDVKPDALGCIGLSGGGCRSGLLQATSEKIRAAVIIGMMTTYEALFDHHVASHTFMLYPSGWTRFGDWPDLVASRAPSPLLVQYDLDDQLFTQQGMYAADNLLKAQYRSVGAERAYRGTFYPGAHKFDLTMQEEAFSWLQRTLKDSSDR